MPDRNRPLFLHSIEHPTKRRRFWHDPMMIRLVGYSVLLGLWAGIGIMLAWRG